MQETLSSLQPGQDANAPPAGFRQRLLALHRRLVPCHESVGYTPYLWLVYLSFYFGYWYFRSPGATEIVLTIIGIPAFLAFYFYGFRVRGRRLIISITGIIAIGVILSFYNLGACVFFIYAASFCGHTRNRHLAFALLAGVLAVSLLQAALLDFSMSFLFPAVFFGLVVGLSNIFFAEIQQKNAALKQTREEVRRLATTAERERIARDLHDLLGHTFSVITLKAELAGRLLETRPQDSRREIADIEQASRNALNQIREAVSGYRGSTLKSELANARMTLETADIDLSYQLDERPLPAELDQLFSVLVKEAVTNIIRHSRARTCHIRTETGASQVVLKIVDDGHGGNFTEGNGLKGMRERIAPLCGDLSIRSDQGTCLTFTFPRSEAA